MDKNTDFNVTKNVKKNRSGKVLVNIIFALLFGFIGACIAIYLIFNIFRNNEDINRIFKLPSSEQSKIYKESKEDDSKTLIDLKAFNDTSVGVAKKVLPSIVSIDIEYDINTVFNSKARSTGSGSGIILSENGYILTNNHVVSPQQDNKFFVVSDAKKITVTLSNDKKYDGEIVGVDKITDLAVVKIKPDKDLVPAVLGDSDNSEIGEFVMAVGSPLGFAGSVTNGIISSINRKVQLNDGTSLTAIQTNASINSGNSGGALVNSKGEVIGINTLKLAGGGVEGLGFAIPINQTKPIVEQLIKNKKVERPSLGFSGKEINEEIAKEFGLPQGILVNEVLDKSTAKNIDLKEKDIVIKLNNKDVKTFSDIEKLKTDLKYGDEITLTVVREGKEKELKGKLVKLPEKEINKENKEENKSSKDNLPKSDSKDEYKNNNNQLFEYFFGN